MFWFTIAFGAPCPLVLATREDYRPVAGELSVAGDPGGWNKSRLAELSPSKRAQIELYKKAFKRYPIAVQNSLIAGQLPGGLDEVAAVIAFGEPGFVWSTDRGCIGMLYGVDDGRPVAYEACEGTLVDRIEMIRPIHCERLASGEERWRKKSKHLKAYSFGQQLDILAGHKDAWMDQRALDLAFGKNGHLAEGFGPVRIPPAPADPPVQEVPATARPGTASPSTTAPHEPPAENPRGARLPVDALDEVPVKPGTWSFRIDCGTPYDFELVLGEGYVARASSRDASGSLVSFTTRGSAQGLEDRVKLLGLGVFVLEPPTLKLGPWPVDGCTGVEAPAR